MSSDTQTDPQSRSYPPVREVPPQRVIHWIKMGWQDYLHSGWPSLLHGLIVLVASIVITLIAFLYWPVLPGAFSGFVLVGPILATGLYALSRRIEKGKKPNLKDAVCAWRTGSKCLWRFGILLLMAGAGWVGVTTLLFSMFVNADINQAELFLQYIFEQNELHFMLWTVLGGLGAALIFSLSVVSVPLLLDRDVETPLALMTSIRAVGDNPVTLFIWAIFILVATGLSVITMMLGFIVLYPVMGHASWHAYRDLVDSSDLPLRPIEESTP